MKTGPEDVDSGCTLPFPRKGTWGKSLLISVLRFPSAEHTKLTFFKLNICVCYPIYFFWGSPLLINPQQLQWDEICIIIISILHRRKPRD